MLDRNGLRPARYLITKHDMMVVASEVGVMDFEPNEIKEKGRLQPGKILLIDTEKGEIYYDSELKEQLANAQPYRTWLEKNRVELDELKSGRKIPHKVEKYDKLLRTFGYSRRGYRTYHRTDLHGRGGTGRLHGQRYATGRIIRPSANPL